ncbi:MAG TPA: VOC family protein [Novosphingobium sp.]|nr:VOC family protein [Novosphingobium sp.]
MSRIFGPIYQNGYVLHDVDAGVAHWTRNLGVGPFFRFRVAFSRYVHRGVESSPVLDVALANSGDLQIELIAQVNDEPSVYQEFLRDHGPGLQHLSVWTDTFDADIARYAALGLKVATEVEITGMMRATFYDTDMAGATGMQMEVLDRTAAAKYTIDTVRQAAIGWDGSEPLRTLG